MKSLLIREKYRSLVNDIDFDQLELELKKPNIFQILNISRAEIRHSSFLAWILDPNGTHSFGPVFLKKFLRDISASEVITDLDEIDIEDLNYNNVEIRREWKNIDLLILFDTHVICIENKVYSQDHSNQLERYRNIINSGFKSRKKAFVYLTPQGEPPTTESETAHYALYSYEQIVEQAERIMAIHGSSLNHGVHQYLYDYISILKRELMKNDDLNELASKLYKNHKEVIDFIFENKSDISSELQPIFSSRIASSGWVLGSKNKGYARFSTQPLAELIPNKGRGWPNKECFLFEFDYLWSKKKAVFKTVISDCDPEIQNVLNKIMETVPGSKKPRGKKWLVHFQHSWDFDTEEMTSVDEDDVNTILDKEWSVITEIVKKVESAMLEHKDEIYKIK
jgi:hypothetical protein